MQGQPEELLRVQQEERALGLRGVLVQGLVQVLGGEPGEAPVERVQDWGP